MNLNWTDVGCNIVVKYIFMSLGSVKIRGEINTIQYIRNKVRIKYLCIIFQIEQSGQPGNCA